VRFGPAWGEPVGDAQASHTRFYKEEETANLCSYSRVGISNDVVLWTMHRGDEADIFVGFE